MFPFKKYHQDSITCCPETSPGQNVDYASLSILAQPWWPHNIEMTYASAQKQEDVVTVIEAYLSYHSHRSLVSWYMVQFHNFLTAYCGQMWSLDMVPKGVWGPLKKLGPPTLRWVQVPPPPSPHPVKEYDTTCITWISVTRIYLYGYEYLKVNRASVP